MDRDRKFMLLVLGIPLAGLVYCGLGIAAMSAIAPIREHPLISGGIFILLPFLTAVSVWISASAKAYRQ